MDWNSLMTLTSGQLYLFYCSAWHKPSLRSTGSLIFDQQEII